MTDPRSKFLEHVDRSGRRLGYLKPDCFPRIAALMEEYEGTHPHQIARKFRQTGQPLSREAKKSIGLRANADMTLEAMTALTEKGLSTPIKGLECTVLDANFAYFRDRQMQAFIGTDLEDDVTFHIRSAWYDCPGCVRLNNQEIEPGELHTLPPVDCANEACALTIRPHVDYGRKAVAAYRERIECETSKKSWLQRLFQR